MREISQATFDEAGRLFALIADYKEQLERATTLAAKLAITRRIDQLVKARRELLGIG